MKLLALAGAVAVFLCSPVRQAVAAEYSKATTLRLYKAPLSKLTDGQLRRERHHSSSYVRFMRSSRIGRYHTAFRHRTCRTVQHDRRGLCFYLRNRVRFHRELVVKIDRLLAPPLPPHYQQWLCIHSHEGAWDDPDEPFFGGLQFMQSTWERNGGLRYAPRADLATPLEQMWIAENAWRESGGSFSQWPNTARMCGLL